MTMLSELLPNITLDEDVFIHGITDDSRKVSNGWLYIAIRGQKNDGKRYVSEVEESAAAILCDGPIPSSSRSIPIIMVDDLKNQRGQIASRFFGDPSKKLTVFAVTGTNGKTSVANFVATTANNLGTQCGVVGTLGVGFPSALDIEKIEGLTTPDAITLQSSLASLLSKGCTMAALEASSHGLSQMRLGGTKIKIAAYTNLSRDHLDYHPSMVSYLNAKRRLMQWPELEIAVLNADDIHCEDISKNVCAEKIFYGFTTKSDVVASSIDLNESGMSFTIDSPWGKATLKSNLMGEFNVSNLLAAAGVLGALGFDFKELTSALGELRNLPGRMHALRRPDCPSIVIDYAHTPAALRSVLLGLRSHFPGKIWCVFGCGGGRDKGKRREMGEIAFELADRLIITSDNPRFEEPEEIANDIVKGIKNSEFYVIELSREMAIKKVISEADQNDVILIAGKGHELYQEVRGNKKSFNDLATVERYISTVSKG